MYSFILFYIGTLLLLTNSGRWAKDQEPSLSNNFQMGKVFLSIILAYSFTGSLGLWLTLLGAAKTKIIYFAGTYFLISLILGTPKLAMASIQGSTMRMISHIIANYPRKQEQKLLIFIAITSVILYIVSVGPINHPDASDYHVGYPKQFLGSGYLLRDGGLHEGLLGVGDFSNIAFLQENTAWLIRSIQIAPLAPIVVTFLIRGTSLVTIIAFLVSFVFVGGWATIGKPLFLGEVCIAGMYLQYILTQSREDRQQLWVTIILALSFKVSTLLICIPVALDSIRRSFVANPYCSTRKDSNSSHILIIFALVILATIMLARYILTGNPLYPLLSSIITPGNNSYERFEYFLKSYMREDIFFPIRMIIPNSLSLIGLTLGPSIIIIAAHKVIKAKHTMSRICDTNWVAISQIVLLIAFAQGRADYYSCPLALLVYGSNFGIQTYNHPQSLIPKIVTKGIYSILIFQSLLFYILATISISQSMSAVFNYEKAMKNFAYGYNESLYLNKLPHPRVNFGSRTTRLYYDPGYIDSDVFDNCLHASGQIDLGFQAKAEQCILKLGLKAVIGSDELKSSRLLDCRISNPLIIAARNPFNSTTTRLTICKIKDKNAHREPNI